MRQIAGGSQSGLRKFLQQVTTLQICKITQNMFSFALVICYGFQWYEGGMFETKWRDWPRDLDYGMWLVRKGGIFQSSSSGLSSWKLYKLYIESCTSSRRQGRARWSGKILAQLTQTFRPPCERLHNSFPDLGRSNRNQTWDRQALGLKREWDEIMK